MLSRQNNTKYNKANRDFIFFVSFAFVLIVFAGFRPVGFDFDSQNYRDFIYYDYQMVEPTFLLIRYFAELFTNDLEVVTRIVFLIYALLNIIILSIAVNKFVRFNLMSLLIYAFTAYAMITITQIRFGVAVAFFLWAIYDLSKSNRKGFILKILFATSFHYSLILALPLIFLSAVNLNRKFYIALPLVFAFSILFKDSLLAIMINNIQLFSDYLAMKLKAYANSEINRTSSSFPLINFLSFLILFNYYIVLIKVKNINNPKFFIIVKVFGWGLAMYFLLSFADVFSKRVLFTLATLLIVLIPFVIHYFKQKIFFLLLILIYVFLYFINVTVKHELLDYHLYIAQGFF